MGDGLKTRSTGFVFGLFVLGLAANSVLAAEVEFSRPSGFYSDAFDLTLSSPAPDATIYYTTNGDRPSTVGAIHYAGSVPIATTTVVRTAAFEQNVMVTEPTARTYLFAADILKQGGAPFPQTWGTNGGCPVPAHYMMTVPDDASGQSLIAGLRSIPSLSIVTDVANLFGYQTGVYVHPQKRGGDWERSVSLELIDPQKETGFRVNCGLRIHGGTSREPKESPKHSFRLLFKSRYGAAKLRFPLFGPDAATEFDALVLRAGNNNSWLDSNGAGRQRADYLRDEWMRRSMSAMDHPSPHGRFVHLYLNGVYWGVYDLCERPGASWLAAEEKVLPAADYDFRKADEIESGDPVAWRQMMALADAGLGDPHRFQALSQRLDLPEFVDFMILNLYAGNSDWDRAANWCAARTRIPGGKFRFFVWDAERTLEDPEVNTIGFDDDESPSHLFQKLSENEEFRSLFATRAQKLLFDDGPLSPESSARRYRALVAELEPAIAAEAARWGTHRRDVHQYKTGPFVRYTAKADWRPEVDRILTRYFPQRRDIVLNQFRERGLFPSKKTPQ